MKLFKVVSRDAPDTMAKKLAQFQEQGFRQFQMKVGADAKTDIDRIFAVSKVLKAGNTLAADANTGWRQQDALRVVKAIRDVDIYIDTILENGTRFAGSSTARDVLGAVLRR